MRVSQSESSVVLLPAFVVLDGDGALPLRTGLGLHPKADPVEEAGRDLDAGLVGHPTNPSGDVLILVLFGRDDDGLVDHELAVPGVLLIPTCMELVEGTDHLFRRGNLLTIMTPAITESNLSCWSVEGTSTMGVIPRSAPTECDTTFRSHATILVDRIEIVNP